MKKLILHIGSHKTGSTSIQNSLNNNDSLLNDNGYSYFNIDPSGSQVSTSTNSWIKLNRDSLKNKTGGASIVEVAKLAVALASFRGNESCLVNT